jgi:ABC-type sugar transport system permease subunit
MVVAMAAVPTVVGLVLAAALFDFVGKHFGSRTVAVLRACFYLPQVLPIAVAGIVWSWILAPENGSLNELLKAIGLGSLQQDWLGDPDLALYTVMGVMVWVQLGFPLVVFMAGLQRVDPQLYEAAELDGAGWWRRFWHITLPQIRPEIYVVLLWCTIAALKVFGAVYVLTKGGPGRGDQRALLLLLHHVLREDAGGLRSGDLHGPDRDHPRPRPRGAEAPDPRRGRRGRAPSVTAARRYPVLVALFIGALFMVLPFLIVAVNAVKSPAEYSSNGPLSLPEGVYLDGLKDFWERVDFGQKLVNSFSSAGRWPWAPSSCRSSTRTRSASAGSRGRVWFLAFLVANMLPQEALVYPLYYLSKEVGPVRHPAQRDHHLHRDPERVRHVPARLGPTGSSRAEMLEAARIDGAGKWRVLWRIVVPVSRPTIGVLFVFFFIWTWNEFFSRWSS